jgi:hypothetical protein
MSELLPVAAAKCARTPIAFVPAGQSTRARQPSSGQFGRRKASETVWGEALLTP